MRPDLLPRRPLHLALLAVFLALPLAGCGAIEEAVRDRVEDEQQQGGGGGGGGGGVGSGTTSMSAAEEAWAADVLARVNDERARAGVPPVAWHVEAAEVAFQHCADMDARDFFAHVNPDGDDPGERLSAAAVPWWTYGENIAWGHDDPAAVMAGWMDSPGHRDNILNPGVTHLGVGVRLQPGGPWWTQVFLTPR
jgi:uncharacterized protein YkwD